MLNKIPPVFWAIIGVVNLFPIGVGITLQDSSMVILGLLTILCCMISYNLSTRIEEDSKDDE